MLKRTDFWRLTISHWGVLPADTYPVPILRFTFRDEQQRPGMHVPYDLDFTHPPSRADLKSVVAQTPWMQCWNESGLLALLDHNDWPMIQVCHKASSVELIDEQGNRVGQLQVHLEFRYENSPYLTPSVSCRLIDRMVNRLPATVREQARTLLRNSENLISERCVSVGDTSELQVAIELRRLLKEAGLRKSA